MVENSASPKTEAPGPRRVLVVEDDEGLNNLAQKALREAGYDTEGVLNGAEAIERVLANPAVVLLLDIKLPDMTGSEIINALIERNCPVPFIVMTGHGDERTAVEMMKLGAGDYLVKELDLVERLPGAFQRLFRKLDTERQLRAAEEELRESEEKYRDLIQQASDGIFICDPEGALLEVNPACRAILGYTDEDFAGSNIRDCLPIDYQGDDQLHLDELTTGKGVLREYDVIRKDGSKIEVEINAIRMSNNQIQGIVRDISERKHAEQALKNSEEKYRSLFEYAGDSIFLINLATHRFVDVNMNATKLLGYSKDELLQLSLEDIYSPEAAENNQAIMQELQDTGSVVFEQTHLRKNGTKVPVEISTRMIRYGEEKVFQSFVRNITKRKQTEEALRESEERFRNLVETSQDMIARCDVKGRFTYLNPAWEKLLGYKLTEMLGHTFSEFKPPEIVKRDLQTFKRTLKGGATFGYETIFISKSGQHKHLVFNSRVLKDSKGKIFGTQATAHDITERRRAEEEREALFEQVVGNQAKLEALSSQMVMAQEAERRHIARELHDEIGQELTAVSIQLGKLHDAYTDSPLGAELSPIVEMVDTSLINIRNLSRELRPSILDDLGLVPALRWLFKRQTPLGGFSATIDDSGLATRPPVDVGIVCFRIVQEALTNIIKHANASKVELELAEVAKELHIKIQDNGQGFDVHAAFEKAARGESMGLLSMEERASLIGGKLEITSEISRGTVINGYFPLNPIEGENE